MISISKLRKSAFVRHNAIFFAGSVAVGAINYAYYPIIGRLLQPAAFGEVQVLVSLFLQFITLLAVVSLVIVNVVANSSAKNAGYIITELEKIALAAAILVFIVIAVSAAFLRDLLQFESAWPFVLLALALVVTVPFTTRSAFLRGKQRFGETSMANGLGAAGKVVASAFLVIIGLGVTGAIGGLVIAQMLAWWFAGWRARVAGLVRPAFVKTWSVPKLRSVAPQLRYGAFVLLGTLGVMVLFSADVILVKRFFDADTAGQYAGIAAVARIVFFLTVSVAYVMMSSIKMNAPVSVNRALFKKSALLVSLVSMPVVLACSIAPNMVITVLMGSTYTAHAELLPWLTVAMAFVSALNLVVLYYLALHKYAPALITVAGALLTCVAISLYHPTLQAVVYMVLIGSVITILAVSTWRAVVYGSRRTV